MMSLAHIFSAAVWTIVTIHTGLTLQMSLLIRNLKLVMLISVRFLL